MNDSVKNIAIFLGIIAVLYLLLRYILPVLFQAVGFVLGLVLKVSIIGVLVLGIAYAGSYLYSHVKNKSNY